MYLAKLELQGFKTFAQKTSVVFPAPRAKNSPITSIVGPNGSGKSNLADAIRWALGEQSLKLLRGKKSEDVIFSGSTGRGRSGFAEVSLTFNNADGTMPIDFHEVVITRRLYRDGNSEYLLNGSTARRSDIQLLLAQANVGQRSYSVIGQGMIDHILVSSPEERKAFFDDATGVKQFQMKRHESMLKLKRTYENLAEIEMLLREVEPRLRSLKRQVSRLGKREEVENTLHDLQHQYYGSLWWLLKDQQKDVGGRFEIVDKKVKAAEQEMKGFENKVSSMETEEKASSNQDVGLMALQKEYRDTQKKRVSIRDEEFDTQKKIELEKVRAQSNWSPLPLSKIIEELQNITTEQTGILKEVQGVKDLEALKPIVKKIDSGQKRSEKLLGRLQRPAPEDIKTDPKLLASLEEFKTKRASVEVELKTLEDKIENYAKKEKKQRTELFDLQRELREKQKQIHTLENERNGMQIERARLEERENNLIREMKEELKGNIDPVIKTRIKEFADTAAIYPEIQRLRYKLELIGGIDPEIVKEYEETNERYEFLSHQVKDLKGAMKSIETIIDDLDEKIRKQSEKAFKEINKEFQRYFKILFGGGSCSLVKMTKTEVENEVEVTLDRALSETGEEVRELEEDNIENIRKRVKEREDRIVGIDIQATPPGKKLKALGLLSGGERALTSIALISAIMAVNPGPFVVLDEVDAALDEANTFRFAAILEELSKLTQFIIITHNRATMEKADVLYGVTMGDDGVSSMISVNMEELTAAGTARR